MGDPGFDLDFSLDGKVSLVTGSARGIGKAIALLYAKKGANIILVDMDDKIKEVEAEIIKLKRKCLSLVYDITKTGNITKIISKSIKEFGKIDILINNAGIVFLEKAENQSFEQWDKTISVNLTAPFLLSQAVGREMIKRKYGKIINIASLAGILGFDMRVAYCSSKAGIIGMTKALAVEWSKYRINVNAISPTVVLTEMGKKAWAGEAGKKMKNKIPLGRFLNPEEVASAAVFLGSDNAGMITGSNIVIDGGYSII